MKDSWEQDDTWFGIVIILTVITGFIFVAEESYDRRVMMIEQEYAAKINPNRVKKYVSPKPEIKLSYEQWKAISEKSLDKIYIPWEHKELTEKTINDFIFMTRIYFDNTMEEINKEEKIKQKEGIK